MIIPILYSPAFINCNTKLADQGAKNWARLSIWVLDKLCGIKYEVRGIENLPKEGGFIVACKHQSMWETIVMHLIFNRPVYAFKKELLKIPFYGWYLTVMSGIVVDRKGGAKALKSMLVQSKKYTDHNRTLVIFPQGTRVPVGASAKDYPYQTGIVAIYNAANCPVVPAALNSGIYWNKNQPKKPGTIIIEFLPAIAPGLDKKEFMTKLEESTEIKSNQLINQ
jgi:1-acyl-sn-glycerol-3-phosphate acyltransferase